MSTIPDLTNLQAVQYSLDHPGVFLTLTGGKITLVNKTGLDTNKVVSTAAWFVERTPDGTSALDDAGIQIRSPLKLHVKGSTKDADEVSEIVTDLLKIQNQDNHQAKQGEYEAYVNLRNRKTCEEHCPWFKEDHLSEPKLEFQSYEDFKKEHLKKHPIQEASPIHPPTSDHDNHQSDEAYTTNSSKPSSSTTSSACITPEPFQGELQKAFLALESTDDCSASSQSTDTAIRHNSPTTDWVLVDPVDKAPISKVDYSDYLFADHKKMPLTNLVSVLSKNHASSNYLSWDSTKGEFTLTKINKSDTSPLVFLQLEDKFLSPKGLYIEKTKVQEIQAQIKSDKLNHTALNALKEHLVSNHLKISSKASDVRI